MVFEVGSDAEVVMKFECSQVEAGLCTSFRCGILTEGYGLNFLNSAVEVVDIHVVCPVMVRLKRITSSATVS